MAIALTLGAPGCDSCRNDHPYVPYAIPTAPSVDAPVALAAGSVAPTAGPADGGQQAPPQATVWERDGLRLRAPEGRHFERGLFADLDGDGRVDAVCVLRVDATPRTFEVHAFRGGTEAAPVRVLTTELSMLPEAAGVHALTRVGARGVLVEVSAEPTASFAQSRRFALIELSPSAARPPAAVTRLSFTVADPPGAPRLGIHPVSADRDGDGVGDLTLTLTVDSADPTPLTAQLVWLDRPAGLSRDPDEPRASLLVHARAASTLTRAPRAKEATQALALVRSTQALARAACAELPGARLSGFTGGAAPECDAGATLEELALAEVKAHAALGRPFAALGAMLRWRGPFVPRSKEKLREAERAVDAVAKPVAPRLVRVLRAAPLAPKRHVPSFAPIAFASASELDVLVAGGVVRADLESGAERESPVPAWPTAVARADGTRLVEVYDGCRGAPRRATFAPMGEGDGHDLAVPLELAFAPPCAAPRGEPVEVMPIGWGPAGLELFVAGEPIAFDAALTRAVLPTQLAEQPGARGAARSPDGRSLVIATDLGVIVRGPLGTRRVRAARGAEAFVEGRPRTCVVNDGASRVACLEGDKVVVADLP